MNSKLNGLLQIFLWFICAFHVIVGLGLNLSSGFPQIMAGYYGATVAWTPELLYILKPVGAFMIAIGIMAAAAARDPVGHRSIVYGLVALFVIRGLQRIAFAEEIASAVAIDSTRNIINAVIFLLLGGVLFFLYNAASKGAGSNT
jgi:hypothetical protein